MSFKVVVINNKCKLSYKENYLSIDSIKKEHLDYISTILINSLEVTVTSYLLNEIIKRKINLVFCDGNKNPTSYLISIYSTGDIYKKLIEQINYNQYRKGYTWGKIVINKLMMQQKLLYMFTGTKNHLQKYIDSVEINDVKNCEAFAARTYFNLLFGNNFNRREDNSINAALNYGYSILLSLVNRVIVSLGYNTALGIKHSNKTNNYNFSCDIMEPFRPLVDKIVSKRKNKDLNSEYKKELVKILNTQIKYKEKIYKLENAVETYLIDIIKCLNTGKDEIGILEFYD